MGSEQEEPRAEFPIHKQTRPSCRQSPGITQLSGKQGPARVVLPGKSLPNGPGYRCPTEPASACLVPTVPSPCCCRSEEGLPVQEDSTGVPLAFREASVPTRAKPLFFSHTKPPGLAASPGSRPSPSQIAPLSPNSTVLSLCAAFRLSQIRFRSHHRNTGRLLEK